LLEVCTQANKSQHPASYESDDKATDEGYQKLYVLPYLNMISQSKFRSRGQQTLEEKRRDAAFVKDELENESEFRDIAASIVPITE
jgi:hypothetical protein